MNIYSYIPVDIEELEDLDIRSAPVKRLQYTFHAMCTSEECGPGKDGVEKPLKRSGDDLCPDCGHYVFWDRRVVE